MKLTLSFVFLSILSSFVLGAPIGNDTVPSTNTTVPNGSAQAAQPGICNKTYILDFDDIKTEMLDVGLNPPPFPYKDFQIGGFSTYQSGQKNFKGQPQNSAPGTNSPGNPNPLGGASETLPNLMPDDQGSGSGSGSSGLGGLLKIGGNSGLGSTLGLPILKRQGGGGGGKGNSIYYGDFIVASILSPTSPSIAPRPNKGYTFDMNSFTYKCTIPPVGEALAQIGKSCSVIVSGTTAEGVGKYHECLYSHNPLDLLGHSPQTCKLGDFKNLLGVTFKTVTLPGAANAALMTTIDDVNVVVHQPCDLSGGSSSGSSGSGGASEGSDGGMGDGSKEGGSGGAGEGDGEGKGNDSGKDESGKGDDSEGDEPGKVSGEEQSGTNEDGKGQTATKDDENQPSDEDGRSTSAPPTATTAVVNDATTSSPQSTQSAGTGVNAQTQGTVDSQQNGNGGDSGTKTHDPKNGGSEGQEGKEASCVQRR